MQLRYKRRRRQPAFPRYDGLVNNFPVVTQVGSGYFRPWRNIPTVAGKLVVPSLPQQRRRRRRRRR